MTSGDISSWRPGQSLPERTILHIYFAAFERYQSRAERMGSTTLRHGFADALVYVGHHYPGATEFGSLIPGSTLWNVPLPASSGPLQYYARMIKLPVWWFRAYPALRKYQFRLIHCHGLAALPLAVALKRRTGASLLYNAHDLESERTGWGWLVRQLARQVERSLIGHVDHALVVSNSIADWYRRAYPRLTVTTIRNVPMRPASKPVRNDLLRKRLGIPDGDLIFLYHGGLSRDRAFDVMIEAFRNSSPDRHLVFLGFGPLLGLVQAAAREHSNIHFHEAVGQDELLHLIAGADVGLVLIPPVSLSYKYSLPNKLFECLAAGLPVIGNDIVEIRRVIDQSGWGWILSAIESDTLSAFVRDLTREEISRKRAAPPAELYWDVEEPQLVAVMQGMLGKGSFAAMPCAQESAARE